ncbi:MAG: hypothetical protein M1834_005224 [Cirrosporium novae-zelandiae]|nr:MAG: hypothetical protein M1834_005224 [Cirrosporium novae-zelandiae]
MIWNCQKKFDPENDIPDLSGKVIFVTGGNAGLGKAAILQFAKHQPAHIYLSGRDATKGATAVEEIKAAIPDAAITFIEADLASLSSVSRAAKEFMSKSSRLDILMCNAGVMALSPALSEDHYEIQFGTNHLGHALLIKLLLPTLLHTASSPPSSSSPTSPTSDVRIIFLTSVGFALTPPGGILFPDLHTSQSNLSGPMGPWYRYGQSKLANILYASELALRYPTLTTVSIHPGVVNTQLISRIQRESLIERIHGWFLQMCASTDVEAGAYNQVWAATTSGENLVNGEFYEPVGRVGRHTGYSRSEKLRGELWEWTQKELEGWGDSGGDC